MAGIRVNVATVVKQALGLYVNVAGVVKPVLEAYVNDNGTVKKFWPDIGPPNAPLNLRSTAQTGSTIALAWDASVENGSPVTGYEISYGTTDFSNIKTVGVVLADTITGLTALTDYQFRIRANSALGYGAYSDTLQVSTVAGAPATPSLSATASNASTVTLRITVGSGPLPTQYRIERAAAGTVVWQVQGTVAYTGSPQTYTASGLSSNQPYQFRVRAENASGNSGYSSNAYRATTVSAPGATATMTVGDSFSGGFSDIGYAAGTAEYTAMSPVGSISGTVNGKTWEQFMQTGASSYVLAVRGTGVTSTLFNRIVIASNDDASGILYANQATFETGLGSDGSFSRWTWSGISEAEAPTFIVGRSTPIQMSY